MESKIINVNEKGTESDISMPLVSVVIAATDIEVLCEHIGSIFGQTYKNIEIIIVSNNENADKKNLRRLMKKYSKRCSARIVPFERVHGYCFYPASNNELFLFGASQAEGEYFVFADDSISYCNTYIADMMEKLKAEQADFAFSDFAVIWKDDSSYKYVNKIDIKESESLLSAFVKNAGKFFGLSLTENKLISRKLWQKAGLDISEFYADDDNNAGMLAGELVFSIALWSNADRVAYTPEIFSIISWEEADNKIRDYYYELKINNIVEELKSSVIFAERTFVEHDIEKEDFEIYFSEFLSRFIWRTEWANQNIKLNVESAFDIPVSEYSLEVFNERTFEIDLSEFETHQNNVSEDNSNMDIKIFVSMHKPSFVPENNKYLLPIQVGTALADERFPDMLHDDEGDNISEKNKMYCELTAQYWAWKNCPDADYYGFWHYRRYLSFNENEKDNEWGVISHDILNNDTLKKSFVDEKHISDICSYYDIVLPNEWNCVEDGKQMTVYEHWCKHFNKDDMDTTVKVILNKYPQYYSAVMDVLQSDSAIFCNMFIMKKELFEEYSAFCFNVLEEVEELIDQKRYNVEEYRTLGHIAERLLAFYVRYIETTRPETDICYLGRTQYKDTRPVAKIIHPGKENCISVMLACDDKYMKYTDVLLQSICENATDDYFYDVVICHCGISEYNQRIAKDIFASKSNIMLRFADVTRNFEKYKNVHIDRHLTYETYYRFLVLDIFEGYDRVLYLDCDMVVNSDIAELFFTEMNDEYIAAVRDYDFIASCVVRKEFYKENILKYINIDDYFNYFQAGVILFNLNTLKNKYTGEKLFKVALSRDWYFHDQDVLNCLFNGHVKYVDDKWNVFSLLEKGSVRENLITKALAAEYAESYKNSINHPCIIHYAGVPKTWDDTEVDLGYIFWKYARKSPYYEKLMQTLIAGDGVKTDWMMYISEPENDKGIKFFTIKTIKEHWTSDYIVLDVIFLSDHQAIETDTLTISASMFPHDTEGMWLDVKQFSWEKKIPVISDNILLHVNSDKNIDIYVRSTATYTGFSFTVRSLESRSIQKPVIEVYNRHFINDTIYLPDGLRKGW